MHSKIEHGRMARAGTALAVAAVLIALIAIKTLIVDVIPREVLLVTWVAIGVGRIALGALAHRYRSTRARVRLIGARAKRFISSSNRTGLPPVQPLEVHHEGMDR